MALEFFMVLHETKISRLFGERWVETRHSHGLKLCLQVVYCKVKIVPVQW